MSINLSINKNNYYSIKFKVHKKLIPYFRKEVISKSLNTKSKRLAKLKFDTIYYLTQQILNTVSIITSDQTQELVNKFIRDNLNKAESVIFTIDTTKYITYFYICVFCHNMSSNC
ncbi:hypothetical protein SAMN06313486_1102 [Epsilonproteobacteria bacterium SCGC AD-308-P11]|nr:hypothetical protein SAMN06313486_1102 [Epsilonproteobacteria bacterium SCGC AD-308-P11]